MISGAAVSALPDVQHLSEISFPIDAIVVEFIGSHYNSFPLNATFEPTVVPPNNLKFLQQLPAATMTALITHHKQLRLHPAWKR